VRAAEGGRPRRRAMATEAGLTSTARQGLGSRAEGTAAQHGLRRGRCAGWPRGREAGTRGAVSTAGGAMAVADEVVAAAL